MNTASQDFTNQWIHHGQLLLRHHTPSLIGKWKGTVVDLRHARPTDRVPACPGVVDHTRPPLPAVRLPIFFLMLLLRPKPLLSFPFLSHDRESRPTEQRRRWRSTGCERDGEERRKKGKKERRGGWLGFFLRNGEEMELGEMGLEPIFNISKNIYLFIYSNYH